MLGVPYFDPAKAYIDEIHDSEIGGMAHLRESETSLLMLEYLNRGAIGEPIGVSAEKGDRIYERLGGERETILREIHANNRPSEEL